MGDGSNSALCHRFCMEFKDDAARLHGPKSPQLRAIFEDLDLDFDGNFEVRLSATVVDGTEKVKVLFDSPLFYFPFIEDAMLVTMVVTFFKLERAAAIERLKNADLIRQTYKEDKDAGREATQDDGGGVQRDAGDAAVAGETGPPSTPRRVP